ncbi:MAG: urease accessory protein UreF [Proteobacteria bacterium]|jgi:urease accessory protein|nr:urease accessory protein UreF [Pseudomonadota bacterium]
MTTEALRLWQLISPALPVGAFHFSQALEQAVSRGIVHDRDTALDWICALLMHSLARVDLPLIERIHDASIRGDTAAIIGWNQFSRACRETRELRDEEAQMGAALVDLARTLDEPLPDVPLGFTAAFAIIAANNNITAVDAATGFAFAWCENQVLVAVRLIPLGHKEGQLMLRTLGDMLAEATAAGAACTDEDLGAGLPGFLMASARHETQYTRLYRS